MLEEYKSYERQTFLLLNQFKFIKHLQNGSFGKVTLAYDTINQCQVSLKIIPKNFRSLQEIQYLNRLNNHPNVCKLNEYFTIGDGSNEKFYVLSLKYYSNGDLYDLVHTRSLSTDEIVSLTNQLVSALNYAHTLGIYHRDLKPENILIDNDNNFIIADWGLATSIRYNNEYHVGSEKYMAPECKNDDSSGKSIDCKYADYWSIGTTILTAILGSCPFKTDISLESGFKSIPNFVNKQIFMNLLRYGSEEEIRTRDLDHFVTQINQYGSYGFDEVSSEEDEIEEVEEEEKHFSMQKELQTYENNDKSIIDLPALVKNSYQSSKSWCDYDDFDFELEISKLNLSKAKKVNINDNEINESKHVNDIRIMETEIFDIVDV